MGAALAGRKDGIIDPFFKVGCLLGILPEEDQARPGSAKGLMAENCRKMISDSDG